jgi:hypothetical protein
MKIPQPSDPVQPIPQAIPTGIDGFVFCLVNCFRHSKIEARRAVEEAKE